MQIIQECSEGYQWSNESSSCVQASQECSSGCETTNETVSSETSGDSNSFTYGPVYKSTASITIVQIATGLGIVLGILRAMFSGASPQDAWTIINFLQVIIVLPLAVKSMTKMTQDFIVSNAFSALSVYYLPVEAIKSTPLVRNLSFDQPDSYLRALGWPSGSTLVNNIVLLIILFVTAIFHVLFCLLYCLTKAKDSKCSIMIKKTYRFLTFTFYIRIFIIAYMLIMLLAVSEIKNYYKNEGGEDFGHQNEGNKNEVKGNYVSLITSCIFQALLFSFLVLTFLSWMRNKSTCKIDGDCKARELYASITKVPNRCLYEEQEGEGDQAEHPENSVAVPFSIKVARLYYLLFLFKRTIMILIVVLVPDSLFVLKI